MAPSQIDPLPSPNGKASPMADQGLGQNQDQKPIPREPRSLAKAAQVQVQNRRFGYLERNPSYFNDPEHELADPLLYDRLVRNFESVAEREARESNPNSRPMLEAAVIRAEARRADFLAPNSGPSDGETAPVEEDKKELVPRVDANWEEPVEDKEQGQEAWHAFLRERFVQGRDEDFDYSTVDNDAELDTVAKRDAEEAWYDEEEPSWAGGGSREGETGIQDF